MLSFVCGLDLDGYSTIDMLAQVAMARIHLYFNTQLFYCAGTGQKVAKHGNFALINQRLPSCNGTLGYKFRITMNNLKKEVERPILVFYMPLYFIRL